jgi:hypothetical protein
VGVKCGDQQERGQEDECAGGEASPDAFAFAGCRFYLAEW